MSETRFAVLIGINDYAVKPLHYCDKDVARLQSNLESSCKFERPNIFAIVSKTDHTIPDIKVALAQAISEIKSRIGPEDTVFFYYSGHGTLENGTHLEFHEYQESLQSVFEVINALSPKNQIYMIDCCHSGYGIDVKSSTDTTAINDLYNQKFSQKADGVQLFYSCKSDETSKAFKEIDNSVYTYYCIEAINNKSLYDSIDHHLSFNLIHEYAVKKIALQPLYDQTPCYFAKMAGFFPFAFLKNQTNLSSCKINIEVEDKTEINNLLNRQGLNFPPQFGRDFEQFMSELVSNLFDHNYAQKVTISIEGNSINISDYSPQSFDPFQTTLRDGMGLRVYKLFLQKYSGHLKTKYRPGNPNSITLEFDEFIFETPAIDPCYIEVQSGFSRIPSVLNRYNLNTNCTEIVIDISKSHCNLSFNHMLVTEFLKRTADTKPMIIIRMDPTDMIRNELQSFVRENFKNERIMVV